jgi:hypothetical protein
MKNLMVYIVEGAGTDLGQVTRNLDLQVENSLALGWRAEDVWIYTNFPYASGGVQATEIQPAERPKTARLTSFHKTHCILAALDLAAPEEVVWYHDTDAYQLEPFTDSPSARPLAFCLYSTRERLLVQGGSMFMRPSARPVFEAVYDLLLHHGCRKDEIALTDVIARPEFADWFDALDYSYNLGSTDFELRHQLAAKPIKVVHFHPGRPEHLRLYVGGNGLGVAPLGERFIQLLERHSAGDPRAAAAMGQAESKPKKYGSLRTFSLRRLLSGRGRR